MILSKPTLSKFLPRLDWRWSLQVIIEDKLHFCSNPWTILCFNQRKSHISLLCYCIIFLVSLSANLPSYHSVSFIFASMKFFECLTHTLALDLWPVILLPPRTLFPSEKAWLILHHLQIFFDKCHHLTKSLLSPLSNLLPLSFLTPFILLLSFCWSY